MRTLFLCVLFLISYNLIFAQEITGLWYSSDSTRIYEIRQNADHKYIAIIKSSERKTDSIGYIILKILSYNSRKKRYEGVIYAVNDGKPAFVKIKFDKHNSNKIVLKLNRMFVMDVTINWVRVDV